MKKNTRKYLLITSILLLVTGLAIGFAAFSNTLTIKSSATVTPDSGNFNVKFSSSATSLQTNAIVPELEKIDGDTVSDFTADNASINNTGIPTISGLKANFVETGQSAIYTFYVRNEGEYDAYLNKVIFNNVSGNSVNKVCTADQGTTQSLVDEACKDIRVYVDFADYEGLPRFSATATATKMMLAKGDSTIVEVTIEYDAASADAIKADGPFTVSFGDISLEYSTTEVSS